MVCSVMGVRLNTGFPPLFLLLLSFHVDHALDTNFYLASTCKGTNYTTGSKFEANMGRVFSTMTNDAPSVGFSHAIAGEGSERVYGLVQCRGDMGPDECRVCISNATKYIIGYCPYSMDASVWYEKCQLRYSNTNFFGLLNFVDYGSWIWVSDQVTDSVFHEKLESLLKNLSSLATTEPSRFMFATGDIPYTDLQTIYGLVQCTRDTSFADCNQCLNHTILQLPSICGDAHGGEIATGSCRVRYDTLLFYDAATTPTPSVPGPPSDSSPSPSPPPNSAPPSDSIPSTSPPPNSAPPSNTASNSTMSEKANHSSDTSVVIITVLTFSLTTTYLLTTPSWLSHIPFV
ncbi:cysteine-rich repeat secretory protein 38-like [Nymphaea colorata]|nr:cysteine-rich repeat secretory protein 38-like [Nymphaea colorata]XP_031500176.1 cysteine-rich repeat secretory protein 38-like [Nymphaea colorata]XP_049936398.1 cysteine-rich repeat secretory protein 38-like [Nymphaea colorata]